MILAAVVAATLAAPPVDPACTALARTLSTAPVTTSTQRVTDDLLDARAYVDRPAQVLIPCTDRIDGPRLDLVASGLAQRPQVRPDGRYDLTMHTPAPGATYLVTFEPDPALLGPDDKPMWRFAAIMGLLVFAAALPQVIALARGVRDDEPVVPTHTAEPA